MVVIDATTRKANKDYVCGLCDEKIKKHIS